MNTLKLLEIDGLNIVRRIYEANLAPDSDQKAQGAVRSSISSIRTALNEHAPTHAIAFFDAGGSTWRHRLSELYRKNRKPMPAQLRAALPGLYQRLRDELGLECRVVPDVEADDALAQTGYAFLAQYPDAQVVVLSTDKDLTQLIAHGIQVYDHFKKENRTAEWVAAKFNVQPHQMRDYLSLMGDTSDDIPGISKVGSKTAVELLNRFGTLQGVLDNAHLVSGKLGERLRDPVERANALLSYALVGFKTDSPLELNWDDIQVRQK